MNWRTEEDSPGGGIRPPRGMNCHDHHKKYKIDSEQSQETEQTEATVHSNRQNKQNRAKRTGRTEGTDKHTKEEKKQNVTEVRCIWISVKIKLAKANGLKEGTQTQRTRGAK